MDMELYKEFIKPEILILIPVLYLIGVMIKSTTLIKDKYIPLVLGIVGIVLVTVYILATEGAENIYMAVFTAVTQGILCAGASVYVNQLVKQLGKSE